MRNQISKLYSAVSAPVAASRDALAETLKSVRDVASLLYNRIVNNTGSGQEKLKDIVENAAEKDWANTAAYYDFKRENEIKETLRKGCKRTYEACTEELHHIYLLDYYLSKHKGSHWKALRRELMPTAWHPDRYWNWCVPEDEKKELEAWFAE